MSNFNYGYEYQDLVAINIALTLLTARKKFKMILDYKEKDKDKLDDIILEIENKKYKMQVKHNKTNENLEKVHFESDTGIFNVPKALYNQSDDIIPVFITNRKYLGDFLIPDVQNEVFEHSKIFKIDNTKIVYDNTDNIIVIPDYFDASFETDKLGELEKEIECKLNYLGIGLYPNENITFEDALKKLAFEFRNLRLKSKEIDSTITNRKVMNIIGLIVTYKELPQSFEIENEYNIMNDELYSNIFENIHNNICIVGEPGIGKSWLVQNMINKIFKPNNVKYIRYTFFRNIQDLSIQDRVNKNVMISNIKKQLINYYGYNKMSNLYGSSLQEILDFLEKNNEKITFIFDGLDHIDREFLIHSSELSKEITEVKNEIISISKKNCNVIIVSQPIEEIDVYLNCGFKKIEMPRFTKDETVMLSKKMGLDLNKDLYQKICAKANGNPLYIRTILNNIKNDSNLQFLDSINDNINSYYNYLLTNVDINQDIISLLINGYITLNVQELNQITGYSEELIQSKINRYLPILKSISIDNSYTIYHESFRRFLLDKIEFAGSNIKILCYRKLANWLMEKENIFTTKIYNTYFQILYEAEKYNEIISKCNYDFIYESYLNGYYAHVNNVLKIIANSLKHTEVTPDKIIEYDLVKNMIWYAKDNIEFEYDSICQYYAKKFSYEKIHSILYTTDEEPILKNDMGLALLYHCDNNNISINWKPYILKYKQEQKNDIKDVTRYIIRYQIINGNIENFINIAKPVPNSESFGKNIIEIIKEELKFKKYDLDETKIEDKKYLKMFQNYGTVYEVLDKHIINEKSFFHNDIGNKIYCLKYANIEEINDFQRKIPNYTDSYIHNWYKLICKTYKAMKKKESIDNNILVWIKEFFNNSYIFSSQGRIVDASGLYDYMIDSIGDILGYIKDKNVLKEVLEFFLENASNATGFLMRTKMGPFTENKILDMLNNIKNKDNQAIFFDTVYKYYIENNISGYYTDIASTYLKIACLGYSYIRDEQASELYKNAIKLLISYYNHKEISIYDLTTTLNKIKKNEDRVIRLYDYLIEIKKRTDGKDISGAVDEYLEFLNNYYSREYILFYIDQLNNLETCDRDFLEDRQYYMYKISKSICFEKTPLIRYFLNLIYNYTGNITSSDVEYFINAYNYLKNKNEDKLASELKEYYDEILNNYEGTITIFDDELYLIAIELLDKKKIIKYKDNYRNNYDKQKIKEETVEFNDIDEMIFYYQLNFPEPNEYSQIKKFLSDGTISIEKKEKLIDLTMEKIISNSYTLRNNQEEVKEIVFLIKKCNLDKYIYYLVKLFAFLTDGWGCLCSSNELLDEVINYDKKQVEKLLYKFIIEAITREDYPIIKQDSRIIECIEKITPNKVQKCIDILYTFLDKRLPLTKEIGSIRNIFKSNTDIKTILMETFDNLNYLISNELKDLLLRELNDLKI